MCLALSAFCSLESAHALYSLLIFGLGVWGGFASKFAMVCMVCFLIFASRGLVFARAFSVKCRVGFMLSL